MDELIANKRVAYYSGCFANYYYPEVGEATLAIMRKNGVEVVVPAQVCCGLPMMSKGNVKEALGNMRKNTAALSDLVSRGYAIITTSSSCGLFLKQEYPRSLQTEEAKSVAQNLYHFSEYMLKLHAIGEMNMELAHIEQTVFYHTPCHLRAQEIGQPTVDLLELIPGTKVVKISELCCGMGGAYGYEKANFNLSKEIAAKLYSEIKENPTDRIVTDCGGCRLQIRAGTNRPVNHPTLLLAEAYGLHARPQPQTIPQSR